MNFYFFLWLSIPLATYLEQRDRRRQVVNVGVQDASNQEQAPAVA